MAFCLIWHLSYFTPFPAQSVTSNFPLQTGILFNIFCSLLLPHFVWICQLARNVHKNAVALGQIAANIRFFLVPWFFKFSGLISMSAVLPPKCFSTSETKTPFLLCRRHQAAFYLLCISLLGAARSSLVTWLPVPRGGGRTTDGSPSRGFGVVGVKWYGFLYSRALLSLELESRRQAERETQS